MSRKEFLWTSYFRSCNRFKRVTSFWWALVEADAGSSHSMIFLDAIQLALAGCESSWAAQDVLKCFSALGEPLPLVAGALIAIDMNLLHELFLRDRLASFDSSPQDPRCARRLGSNFACITAGLGAPKMQLAHLVGSHHLSVEEGRHLNRPRASRVCSLCNTKALGDERHILLKCSALAGLMLKLSSP